MTVLYTSGPANRHWRNYDSKLKMPSTEHLKQLLLLFLFFNFYSDLIIYWLEKVWPSLTKSEGYLLQGNKNKTNHHHHQNQRHKKQEVKKQKQTQNKQWNTHSALTQSGKNELDTWRWTCFPVLSFYCDPFNPSDETSSFIILASASICMCVYCMCVYCVCVLVRVCPCCMCVCVCVRMCVCVVCMHSIITVTGGTKYSERK